MGWKGTAADLLLPGVLRTSTGVRALASVSRRHPEIRDGRLGGLVFPRVPTAGTRKAAFGRGRVITCDLSVSYDRSIYSGNEEMKERQLVERLVQPGDVFVDVGANLGLFTLFAGANVGDRGRVYAFEAVPTTAARLRANVAASGLTARVQIRQVALSDVAGAEVHLSGHRHNTMRVMDEPSDDSVTVGTTTLDHELGDLPFVSGMKIDVDGHELAVLRGAETVLRRAPWILIEFNSGIVGVNQLGDWDVHRHLVERGYQAYHPYAVLRGDFTPVADEWTHDYLYVNLVYWRGPPPRPLDPTTERAGRRGRVAKHGPVELPAALAAARLAVARRLVRIDRGRRRLGRARRRVSTPPADLAAPPTAVLAAIAHWRRPGGPTAERLRDFTRVVDGLLAIDVARVSVVVLSNDADAAAQDLSRHLADTGRTIPVRVAAGPRDAVVASGPDREVVVMRWRPGLVRRHGFYLTWAHVPVFRRAVRSGCFSHLVYLEDDILFTDAHLRYWCAYRPALAEHGLMPGFVRYETLDGVRFVTDQSDPVEPSERRIAIEPVPGLRCHEFVNLPNPHQAMYVLDMPLADAHFRFSANRSPLRSVTVAERTGFGLCERNSSGPIFDEVPPGLVSRNVVPISVEAGRVRLDEACLVDHVSATYVVNERSPFATIRVEDLFTESTTPTRSDLAS